MNCEETAREFDAWWDGELTGRQAREVELHLEGCAPCARRRREMEALQEFLQENQRMPEALAAGVWRSVRPGGRSNPWRRYLSRTVHTARDLLRIERRTLTAKLAAAPVTLLLFLLVSGQFSGAVWQPWSYPLVEVSDDMARRPAEPVMVQVLHSKQELRSLVEVAWKLPYEDSLSVVAGIQPEGNARIESVLESPRSPELLEAVDWALRHSKFEQAGLHGESAVIYSFQKIDVYGGL